MPIGLNCEILELLDIVPGFIPVNMSGGTNVGQWLSMAQYERGCIVVYHAAGTAADDPVYTFQQAKDNAGTGAKAVTYNRYRTKLGTITTAANQVWTLTTVAPTSTLTVVSAAAAALIAVELRAFDLDINNGFTHINISIAATSQTQLGCAFYLAGGNKYPQSILQNPEL